jgi:hypothetical protein
MYMKMNERAKAIRKPRIVRPISLLDPETPAVYPGCRFIDRTSSPSVPSTELCEKPGLRLAVSIT